QRAPAAGRTPGDTAAPHCRIDRAVVLGPPGPRLARHRGLPEGASTGSQSGSNGSLARRASPSPPTTVAHHPIAPQGVKENPTIPVTVAQSVRTRDRSETISQ